MNAIRKSRAEPATAVTLAEPRAPDSLMDFLARGVRDKSVDVSKLQAMYEMHRAIVADELRAEFDEAMSATQAEMAPVVRNALNTEKGNKYATLEAVDAAVRPIYTSHGLRLSFTEVVTDAPELRIACIVSRRGHSETYYLSALSDTTGPKGTPNKTSVQGVGSSVSYLRRYLTCMIFNVALRDDNDGNRQQQREDTGEVIGEAQAAELYALLAECSANPRKVAANERSFLDKLGMRDTRTIQHIPPAQFGRLKNALLTKRAHIAARHAANTNTTQETAA